MSKPKEIIGVSNHINELHRHISQAAQTNDTVLIQGPTGTGKELVAKNIHLESARREKPFVTLNCAAIATDLFESEFFGHKRGSFSGAFGDKVGTVKLADGGTLFLDEIGDLTPNHQTKILRFLQEREYCPVGGTQPERVDVRVTAATNKDLQTEIQGKRFREDLLYRLSQYKIYTEPLADRPEDIICLVHHFNQRADSKTKVLLYSYDFPGNVRQLENLAKKDYDYLRNEVVRECAARLDSKPDEVLRLQTRQEFHDFIGELNSSKIEQSGVSWKTAIGLLEMIFYLDKFPEDLEELKDLEELMKLYELSVLEGDAHLSKTQIAKVLKIRRGKVTDEVMPDEYYSRILKIDFRRRYPSYIAPFFHLHRRQEVCVQGIKWLLGLSFLRNH